METLIGIRNMQKLCIEMEECENCPLNDKVCFANLDVYTDIDRFAESIKIANEWAKSKGVRNENNNTR